MRAPRCERPVCQARAGEVKDFTGISAPFEAPEKPDVQTAGREPEATIDDLYEHLLPARADGLKQNSPQRREERQDKTRR